jgi:peptidoglycan/LPS O-acetylase OafA/YrhL
MIKTENNFDILRLMLAVLVFMMHWNSLTQQNISNQIFHMGEYAVDVFFIVSGFLIFWSFDNDSDKKHFYIKRFFRIFPLYAILVLLQALFFIIYSEGSVGQIIKYFISNIFFLNFLSPSVGNTLSELVRDTLNGSLWTLKNEVLFYIFIPALFFYLKKFSIWFLLFLYALSVVYMFISNSIGYEKLLVLFPGQLRLFLVGIMLYVLFDKINKSNIYLLMPISLLLIVLFRDNQYFEFSVYPILLGVVAIFAVYYIPAIKIKFDFSYSFYILHYPIIQLSIYFGINPKYPILSFMTLFCIILLLSYLSEKYIEKRFIQMGKDIIKRRYPR